MSLAEEQEPRRTILVVDDAPMFREIETTFLRRTARVLTATDGTEALEIARAHRPDIIVSDLTMVAMDGDELCTRLRNDVDLRRTPTIIVTSGRSPEEHERAVRAGADDVLEKPLSRVTLLQAVNRFLRLTVRGLDRVPLETEVCLRSSAGDETWAWALNLSRGGMFVEADTALEPETELDVEFTLPASDETVHPSARVVWRRPPNADARAGMGLQFLKLGQDEARLIENYVYERVSADRFEIDETGEAGDRPA
ncbi:MAG: TIGR02266 family protein [Myxococcota bacterium]